ncbi:PilZ domain-containing protein [Methylobacterium sp. A49B]
MAKNGRGDPRRIALKTGEICFGDPQECRDCLIWDISKSGAMIEIKEGMVTPETFRLVSAGLYLNQLCEVIWRDGSKIGLQFIV